MIEYYEFQNFAENNYFPSMSIFSTDKTYSDLCLDIGNWFSNFVDDLEDGHANRTTN